jgi:hypothetical protein
MLDYMNFTSFTAPTKKNVFLEISYSTIISFRNAFFQPERVMGKANHSLQSRLRVCFPKDDVVRRKSK